MLKAADLLYGDLIDTYIEYACFVFSYIFKRYFRVQCYIDIDRRFSSSKRKTGNRVRSTEVAVKKNSDHTVKMTQLIKNPYIEEKNQKIRIF